MKVVYLLQHSYELENGCDETKVLGIFSSRQKAKLAIINYSKLSGFEDRKDDFYIDEYLLDKEYWQEGFTFTPSHT